MPNYRETYTYLFKMETFINFMLYYYTYCFTFTNYCYLYHINVCSITR
ncbi:unnamed protein product [Schistosoma mattheei]|uniref:Uncharacterized protein n=1 Tax=Schistosoma mattheei TaxID=31246 RepID=A0A183Q5U0_9TREM|nr:unnamed protein product [Schistosoma mattheei]